MFFSTAKRTKSAPTSELLLCILKLAFRNVRVSSWPGNACIQKQQQRKMKNFPNLDTKSCRWYNVVLRIKAHIQDILRGQQKRFSPYYRMAFLLVRRTSHISYVERYFQSCKQNCKNFPNWEKRLYPYYRMAFLLVWRTTHIYQSVPTLSSESSSS